MPGEPEQRPAETCRPSTATLPRSGGHRKGRMSSGTWPRAPEGTGAERRLVVAGRGAGGLVAGDHVLQGGLLDHVEADAHAVGPFHVIDVVRLQDGVDGQVLNVQLHAHCTQTPVLTH